MKPISTIDWDLLSDLLVQVVDMPVPTWPEKRESTIQNLSASGLAALREIVSWGWE